MNKRSWIIPLVVLLVAAGLLFAIAGHWTEWEGHRAEQRTDDAYLRADMTPLSTRISGTVRKMLATMKASKLLRLSLNSTCRRAGRKGQNRGRSAS